MNCPICNALCVCDESIEMPGSNRYLWSCPNCGWDEDQMFPMTDQDWEIWLEEGRL